uniref:Rho-GAP domain-containing protein n=1 Tax=Micromonas pusilla TaxID=38833 RepID=A0A7S0KKI8_MICPS|mmetsp:Transcript_1537/g.5812  ORF Transcript_1537/g.5812 Transcript_1537/m.5812 type:complete len:443 (+) Transcript_1537:179-1507(+)
MPVFGVSVQDACRESGGLPRVVAETIAWLDAHVGVKPAENMFKVRGDHNKIQECRIRYDRGEVMPLKGCADAHTVAGVLKLYLASLPEPLLTFRLYDSLLAVAAMPSRSRRVLALGSLLDSLDVSAKRTLSAVSAFLRRCAQANARCAQAERAHADETATLARCVRDISTAFSPLLLRLRGAQRDAAALAEDTARADHVVELLVEHHAEIIGLNRHKHRLQGAGTDPGDGREVTSRKGGGLGASDNGRNAHGDERARVAAASLGKENASDGGAKTFQTRTAKDEESSSSKKERSKEESSNAHVARRPVATVDVHLADDFADVAMDGLIDEFVGWSVGGLMGGDDLFTAEIDRAAGSALEVLYKGGIHRMPPDELAAEKQHIKRRLRSFDNHVAACSGRKATKEDKRHLRPLYLRLAHVKRQIGVLEQSGAGQHGAQRGTART